MNGSELRSHTELKSHFQILTKIVYAEFSRNLQIDKFFKFVFTHCKSVKVSQNDQIRI